MHTPQIVRLVSGDDAGVNHYTAVYHLLLNSDFSEITEIKALNYYEFESAMFTKHHSREDAQPELINAMIRVRHFGQMYKRSRDKDGISPIRL